MENTQINHGYWLFLAFLFAGLPLSSSLSQGKRLPYMTSDITEVSGKSFDYIVVGGGTAGCPLAATLSERYSVLVVERGGSPFQNPFILEGKYLGTPLLQTDEFSSIAQRFIPQDGVVNYRGRVLGGSSAINFGFYSRASDDFVSRAGWDKKLVKEAYEWVESRIISKPNNLSNFQSALKSGLLEAGIRPYNGFSLEHIQGTKIGGSLFDINGTRHFAAHLLQTANPCNITVLLNATVKNIIFQSNGKGNGSTVHGVRFIKSDGSSTDQTYEAYLSQPVSSDKRGDVILSAGAIGSPQLLLLSGVGPKHHLKKFGIPVVLDLEGVGEEMQDNPRINAISTTERQYADVPHIAGITEGFKFIIEGAIAPISFNASARMIATKIAIIESKGKLELNNTDPRQNPLVKFNYLEKKQDMEKCIEMVQLLRKVARSKSLTPFFGTPSIATQNNSASSSPQELRKFCKKNLDTFFHYHGGCTVGSVVNNDYRVYGLKGLRVIDGSTFSNSPGTNPSATLLMLGRYQGIKILKEREKHASAFTTQSQPHKGNNNNNNNNNP